jgi:sugar lactone lactonase YvrE
MFCPTATWNPNGITFANQSILGDYPRAIFVNTNNTIYVANRQNNQILVWNEGSESPTKIVSGNFTGPNSTFVTSNGDIYIDDGEENGRVQKWISTTETFDTVMNVDSSCYGLFVDIKDNLYCSMSDHHRVVKRSLNDPVMTTVVVAGTGSEGWASDELYFPFGIFVDVNLDLYVADCDNNRVQLFQSEQLNGITVAGKESLYETIRLYRPFGISLDAEKYLFILDLGENRIVGSGPNGFRCLVGCYGYGSQSNQLDSPFSFSFDRSGNMFVIDLENNRIQKFLLMEKSCGKLKKI